MKTILFNKREMKLKEKTRKNKGINRLAYFFSSLMWILIITRAIGLDRRRTFQSSRFLSFTIRGV
jgi:hypothetical protein